VANDQDVSGTWHAGPSATLDATTVYQTTPGTFSVATSSNGFMQVIALDSGGSPHLAGYLDTSGGWHVGFPLPTAPGIAYQSVAVAPGNGGALQVVGIGVDRNVYLVSWQDSTGQWNGQSGNQLNTSGAFTRIARSSRATAAISR
jgi:hypothetical protein